MKIEPATRFSNGTSYEVFLNSFCYRCDKGKLNNEGFAEHPENGGCPIWDAMESARWGCEFPSDNIVRIIDDNDEVIYWEICKGFKSKDEKLMESYKKLFEGVENNEH